MQKQRETPTETAEDIVAPRQEKGGGTGDIPESKRRQTQQPQPKAAA